MEFSMSIIFTKHSWRSMIKFMIQWHWQLTWCYKHQLESQFFFFGNWLNFLQIEMENLKKNFQVSTRKHLSIVIKSLAFRRKQQQKVCFLGHILYPSKCDLFIINVIFMQCLINRINLRNRAIITLVLFFLLSL